MSDRLGIRIETSYELNAKELQSALTKLSQSQNFSIKLNFSDNLKLFEKQVDDVKKNISRKTVKNDSQFINSKVEKQAFDEITNRIKEVRKNVDELAKVNISTNTKGGIQSATLSYYNKELGQTITETMKWSTAQKKVNDELVSVRTFGTTNFKYSDNIAQATKNIQSQSDATIKLSQNIRKFQSEIEQFKYSYKGLFDPKTIDGFSDSLSKISNLKELNEAKTQWKELTTSIKTAPKAIDETNKASTTFFNGLKRNLVKFSEWSIITVGWYSVASAIKGGLEAILSLDSSLVELNKVADLSASRLKIVTEEAYNLGETIGRTGQEVINVQADFIKMGYSVEQSLKLAEQALLFYNISDGIASVDEASQTIISTLKGFNMEASETARITDVINEVSNRYAVSSGSLAQGLTVVSSVMAQSNTSLEETIALLTASDEVMQNMSKSSHGLVTISQRLRGLSEEGESLGDNFTAKLGEAFKTIANVDIMKNGQLRSTYEILSDTSKVWNTLSNEQKQFLGEQAAGIRQVNVFNSLMSNQSTLLNAVTDGLNSQGSSLAENEKFLNSIQGRINLFNSSLQQMWSNAINSDFIKYIVDLGTSIISLVDSIGLLNSVMLVLSSYLAISGKILVLIPALKQLRVEIALLSATMGASAEMSVALGTALASIAPFAIIGAIALIIKAFDDGITTATEWNDKLVATNVSLETLKDKIKSLQQEEKSLTEGAVEGSTQRLDLLQKEIEANERLLELKEQQRFNDINVRFEDNVVSKAEPFNAESLRSGLATLSEVYEDQMSIISGYNEKIDDTGTAYSMLSAVILDIESKMKGLDISTKEGSDEYLKLSRILNDANIQYEEYKTQIIDQIKLLESVPYDKLTSGAKKYLDQLNNLIGTTDNYTDNFVKHAEAANNAADALDDAGDSTLDFASSQQLLNQALSELNSTGSLTGETLSMLLQYYPDLTEEILGSTQEVEKFTEKYKGLGEDQIAVQSAITASAIENAKARIKAYDVEYQELAALYKASGDSFLGKLLADNSVEIDKAFGELNSLYSESIALKGLSGGGSKSSSGSSSKTAKEAKQLEAYFKELQAVTDLENELSLLRSKSEATGVDNSQEELSLLDKQQDALHILNNARRKELSTVQSKLKTNKNDVELLERQAELMDEIAQTSDNWWSIENDKKQIFEEQAEALEQQAELQREAQADIRSLIIDALKDQADAKKDQLNQTKDSIEEEIKLVEEAEKEKLEIKYNALKEGFDREKELLQKQLDEAQQAEERAEKVKEIESLQSKLQLPLTEKERYDLQKQLSELQKDLIKSDTEYEIEKKLEALEAQSNIADQKLDAELYSLEQGKNKHVESTKIKIYWEGELTRVTVEEARKRLDKVESDLTKMDSKTRNWAKEAEKIYKQGGDAVYTFLASNLQNFSTYTDAMIKELKEKLSLAESGAIPTTTTTTGKKPQSTSNPSSLGFGTTESEASKEYYASLKAATGNNKEAFKSAELARTENVIKEREKAGLDTSAQKAYKESLKNNTFKFDSGGEANGIGWIRKDTIKPERILDPNQTISFDKLTNILPETLKILTRFNTMSVPQLAGVGGGNSNVTVNVTLKDAILGSAEGVKKTVSDLGDKISVLKEVQGIGTSVARNSRK